MPVKLKKDQFTAGDMDFHVRRRFKPSAGYAKKFYTSGDTNLLGLKESNQYYNYHDKKMPITGL
jgi:hypothetical protein